jgi:hypothetical protein
LELKVKATTDTDSDMRPDGLKQSDVDYLSTLHIHFSLPIHDGKVSDALLVAMMKWAVISRDLGIQFSIDTIKYDALIPRARNNLVARFMTNPHATHLMFIDSDMVFESEYIVRMLIARKDVVAAAYPIKDLPVKYEFDPLENPDVETDLVEVSEVSTGFLLIKKEVIQKLIDAHPELKYNNMALVKEAQPYTYALFDTSIDVMNNYLTEYQTFSRRWRDLGGKLYVDVGLKVDHIGQVAFPGDPNEIISQIHKKFKNE